MNLWNIKNLPIPPIDSYKAVDTSIDINHLRKVLEDGIHFLRTERHMTAEHAVMSRIVYRSKQKFRPSKDFKALQKIGKALDNYFKTDIVSDLQNFLDLIPDRYTDETYLPNKNLVDYILVRLQGIVKLMERIVETCKITAYLFERRMHTGHFWKIGFIIFSLVSRVYVLAKYNAKFICEFYGKVFPFSSQLRNSGRKWLPDNYILPTDLQKWINVTWLDVDDDLQIIEPSELSQITQFFDLADDDDDDIQFCDEYVMVDDEDDVDVANNKKMESNEIKPDIIRLRGFDMDEDVGEVIDINDMGDIGEIVEVTDSEVISLDTTLNDSNGSDNETSEVIALDEGVNENVGVVSQTSQIISLLDDSSRSELQGGPEEHTKSKKKREKMALKKKKAKNINSGMKTSETKAEGKKISKMAVIPETSAESDRENVIILSDSSVLPDDTVDKIPRRKKLKTKTNRNTNNFSSTFSRENGELIDCDSEKNKNTKLKIEQPNGNPGVKRKSETNAGGSRKKVKSMEPPTAKNILPVNANQKKNMVEQGNFKRNSNSTQNSMSNGVHDRKNKSNKAKKKKSKLLKNIQLAHKSGKLTHAHNLKVDHNSRRKRKYRYFL